MARHEPDGTEIIGAVTWHLECIRFSRSHIYNMRPPADTFDMRINYSLYVINLMSTVDIIRDYVCKDLESTLERFLGTTSSSGNDVLQYMRHLRNGIIHRGANITMSGNEINGLVWLRSPEMVFSQDGQTAYLAPFVYLHDLFDHFEKNALPHLKEAIEKKVLELKTNSPKKKLECILKEVTNSKYIPVRVKEMAYEYITPQMVAVSEDTQLNRLRELLTYSKLPKETTLE